MGYHICGSKIAKQWNENGIASVFYCFICFGSTFEGVLLSPVRERVVFLFWGLGFFWVFVFMVAYLGNSTENSKRSIVL